MERPALHDILCKVLKAPFPDGKDHCYFQPPASLEMDYPCIIYHYLNDIDTYADNTIYQSYKKYKVIVIDEDQDSKIPERLKEIPYCSLDIKFTVEGLNHFVYILSYNGPRIKEE